LAARNKESLMQSLDDNTVLVQAPWESEGGSTAGHVCCELRATDTVWGYSLLLAYSSEYQEGEAAFRRGLTTRNNPYPFRSPEYWRWQEGLLGNCRPRDWRVIPEPYK
jgi:hypothetical protein